MTGEVLLDTSVVVAHLRGDGAVTARLLENDIWIAAVAAQHGLPLAHRDTHFGRIQEDGPVLLAW
jgi:predicted nucleic acid-binding protein